MLPQVGAGTEGAATAEGVIGVRAGAQTVGLRLGLRLGLNIGERDDATWVVPVDEARPRAERNTAAGAGAEIRVGAGEIPGACTRARAVSLTANVPVVVAKIRSES